MGPSLRLGSEQDWPERIADSLKRLVDRMNRDFGPGEARAGKMPSERTISPGMAAASRRCTSNQVSRPNGRIRFSYMPGPRLGRVRGIYSLVIVREVAGLFIDGVFLLRIPGNFSCARLLVRYCLEFGSIS